MKILGIKKFTSKDGKKCCMVFVEDDFSMFDKGNAEICVGKKTDVVWVPEAIAHKLNDKDVGKNLVVTSTISRGKAYINDIMVG